MNIGFFGLLQLVFIVLKVIDQLTWSWWWVFAPTYIHFIIYCFIVVVVIPWLDKKYPVWRLK